jgi:hypothetical protein
MAPTTAPGGRHDGKACKKGSPALCKIHGGEDERHPGSLGNGIGWEPSPCSSDMPAQDRPLGSAQNQVGGQGHSAAQQKY